MSLSESENRERIQKEKVLGDQGGNPHHSGTSDGIIYDIELDQEQGPLWKPVKRYGIGN